MTPERLDKCRTVFKQDIFTLPEGNIVLRLPHPMSEGDFLIFKEWIALILRRTERTLLVEEKK